METKKIDEIIGVYKVRRSGNATVIAMPQVQKGDRYVLVRYPGGIFAYYPLQAYTDTEPEPEG